MCFIDPEPPTSPPPSFFAIFQAAKIVICILLWLKIGGGGGLGLGLGYVLGLAPSMLGGQSGPT